MAKFLERLDRHDYEAAGVLVDEDLELVHPAASVTGREQVMGFFEASFRAFPDSHHALQTVIEGPTGVAVEGTWHGTHTEIMSTPMGDVPPTGKAAAVTFAVVAGVNDGKITSLHIYSDQLSFMTQLGLMPAPPS
jgi:steroid delta-isomerase-like uncharacterized protein